MQKNELLTALNAVRPGIANKEVVESMTYFYFSGSNVVSYNDSISIQYPLKTGFKAFVKANDMYKVVSKMKEGTIFDFAMEGNQLKMPVSVVGKGGKKSQKALIQFSTIIDDAIIDRVNSVQETVDLKKMKDLPTNFVELLRMCSHAASNSDGDQQTLNCIYINKKDMVATDNVRIAHGVLTSDMEMMLFKASETNALVAVKPLKYQNAQSWIHFLCENDCVFSIRKTKGAYPDMIKFTKFEGTAVSLPKDILHGVDVAAVYTDNVDTAIDISIKPGICRIFKESGAGKIDFREPIKYDGPQLSFKISPQLLKEMLNLNTDITLSDNRTRLVSGNLTFVTALFKE